ncbi:MAG TPA: hypothetical protein IAB58_03320 [Candidatus Pelethosoma merdigallinarum]|nr:hypothetical protein [Candidatus Pelethosoma merdigallinarum]
MDRKGQVLVGFLLLLPLLLILFVFVIDIGFMKVEERKLENTVKEAITYGLKQESPEEEVQQQVETMIRKNIDNIEFLDTVVTNGNIQVHLSTRQKNVFGIILNQRMYKIEKRYQGYLENETIKIIKE